MSVDDKYTYPGSGGVLVNKLGILDADALDRALNDFVSAAWADLIRNPPPGDLELTFLTRVHTRMFDRVLPFAGMLRDVDAQASGTGIPYCRPTFVAPQLDSFFRALARDNYLRGLQRSVFADRLAERWGELTAIHPFRDGNTRSQSFFVTALCERAGYSMDWRSISPDELRTTRLQAMSATARPLADLLFSHLSELPPGNSLARRRHWIGEKGLRRSSPAALVHLDDHRRRPLPDASETRDDR